VDLIGNPKPRSTFPAKPAGVALVPTSLNCGLLSLARQAPPQSTPYELARMRTPAHVLKAISFHPRNGVLEALRGI